MTGRDFLEGLIRSSELHVDRPRGFTHPRRAELVYPFDHGELLGTVGGDGQGIDVCLGEGDRTQLAGVLLTVNPEKCDAEVKMVLGWSPEQSLILPGGAGRWWACHAC